MVIRLKFLLFALFFFVHMVFYGCKTDYRPTIWVYSDMSDPRDTREGGHPQNDPDDITTLASLLLYANMFNIESIVVGSNTRAGLKDPMPFVEDVFLEAYYHDVKYLNQKLGGYPEQINIQPSSLVGESTRFDPNKDYSDLSGLETVRQLVKAAEKRKIYVLNWGPLTESAMAVKHCLDTGNDKALRNMFFISHWTKSSVSQGTPEQPFNVANCNDDRPACNYMHEIAYANDQVRFIEVGCIGQTGLVNGSGGYRNYEAFENSRLGQIFLRSKFYFGKPDYSDGATHFILDGRFGLTKDDYPHDGTLTIELEKKLVEKSRAIAHDIIDELLARSNVAAIANNPFEKEKMASYFTYVYSRRPGSYGVHIPYDDTVLKLFNSQNEEVKVFNLDFGNHTLDLSGLEPGEYDVTVSIVGTELNFKLTIN
jgi:hypothetical protein